MDRRTLLKSAAALAAPAIVLARASPPSNSPAANRFGMCMPVLPGWPASGGLRRANADRAWLRSPGLVGATARHGVPAAHGPGSPLTATRETSNIRLGYNSTIKPRSGSNEANPGDLTVLAVGGLGDGPGDTNIRYARSLPDIGRKPCHDNGGCHGRPA